MISLTLHALDDQLAGRLRSRADEMHTSMNKLAKQLLAEGLGIKAASTSKHRDEFAGFCGCWSAADGRAFDESMADMRQVDPGDWQ